MKPQDSGSKKNYPSFQPSFGRKKKKSRGEPGRDLKAWKARR